MKKQTLILSIILSLFIMIGISFDLYKNLNLFTKKSVILLITISIFILYKILTILFQKLDKITNQKQKHYKSKILNLFLKHPFTFSFLFILICWLPYIISFYPAILSKDPSYQILQYFNIDNKYSYYVPLLDPNRIITNHHPIMHTLLLGSCTKLGEKILNINLGLFFYSIIQITILISTLSYTISFMKKINTPTKYLIFCILIYSFVPVFPLYGMSPVKDVIFSCLIIIYIITITKIILYNKKFTITKIIKITLLLILITLFRNNGIHILILSFPFLLILKIKNKKQLAFIFLTTLVMYTTYKNQILPTLKITPGSIREKFSIPFQQTARYVLHHQEEITEEEKNAIDKILNYNTLKERYKGEIADPVKNEFNPSATKKDLQKYFKVWFLELKKHPKTYIEATLHNTYGYFYPLKTNWYIYHKYNHILRNHNLNYHYNNCKKSRNFLVQYANLFPYIPILGLIVNIGFSTWMLLIMITYLIYRKKYKELTIYIPSIIVLLVCIASPVNTYFRYAMPNIFAMPSLIAIFINTIQRKEVKKNEKSKNCNINTML